MSRELGQKRNKLVYDGKPKVAFVCVHNSCRSQIAEALGNKFASDVFESYSAGTEVQEHINSDAVRVMKYLKRQYRRLNRRLWSLRRNCIRTR